MFKERRLYVVCALISFVICVGIIVVFDHHPFIRGFLGDVIFVLFLYSLFQSFKKFRAVPCVLCVLGMCYIAEIIQYFQLIKYLKLENNTVLRVLLGSVFDSKDLIAYTVGAGLTYLIDRKLNRNTTSP